MKSGIMEEKVNKAERKCNVILWIIIALLVVISGTLIYLLNDQKEQTEIRIQEVIETTKEKEAAKAELRAMYSYADSLMSTNDSMNTLLDEKKEYIQTLITTIDRQDYDKRKLKKELGTLRAVLKDYVYQIDSLNTSNIALREENAEVKKQFQRVKKIKEELEVEKTTLREQVEVASTLQAENLMIEVKRKRGRITKFADKAQNISVCFQLWENAVAQEGKKDIYIRIARPDELVLAHAEDNLFEYEGKQIVYSAMRSIDYFKQTMDVCIYYDIMEELIPGEYAVDIFTEGKLIGTATFTLK